MTRLALATLAAVLCAACSTSVGGSPKPAQAGPQLPPRPRAGRIDGLDPCSALTPAQVRSLGVRYYATDAPTGTLGPSCDWNHSPAEPVESYTVDINTKGAVELAFGQPQL